jgi:hypothetical protein
MPYYVQSHHRQALCATPEPVGGEFLGFGWNWFDHLGSGGVFGGDSMYRMDREVLPPLENTAAWAGLKAHLDILRPGFIRFGIPPDAHCDAAGNFTGGTKHIERLAWLDRWARDNQCTIVLDTHTIPKSHEFKEPPKPRPGLSHCNMAARDNHAYAVRFVAPMMRHLVRDLGLRTLRFFNPVNEAMQYGVYETPAGGPEVTAHYVDMYRQMRAALDAAGLPRAVVGLVGCDSLCERDLFLYEMLANRVDIDPWVDAYSAHFYNIKFDYMPPADGSWTSPIIDVLRRLEAWQRYLSRRGKPLFVGEISTFHYGWKANNPQGAACVDACLTLAEASLRMIAKGARCFAVWQMFDTNDNDGCWNALEFGADGQWHPQGHKYAVYGMLARSLRPGSAIWELEPDPATNLSNVHGAALRHADGRRGIVLLNNDPIHDKTLSLRLPEGFAGARLECVTTDRIRLCAGGPPALVEADGTLEYRIPSFSIVAMEQRT